MNADRAAAAGLMLLGLFVTYQAWALPYWLERSPGPGFLPRWLGLLLVACAAGVFLRSGQPARAASEPLESPEPSLEPPELRERSISDAVALAVITAGTAAIVPLVGLVAATAALTAAAAWWLDPRRPYAIAAATVLTPAFVWLVFVRWLGVPLP